MVKLVGVFQGKKGRSLDCKARRYMPLEIEPDLTMAMALDDFCMACGPTGRKPHSADWDLFMRNYNCLDKDEVSASLMVTWEETLGVLAQTVNCVSCRRSVENLYYSLRDCDDSAIDPLIVTPEGFMSINREHVTAPCSLANLFCYQVSRLSQLYVDAPANKKVVAKRGGRCPSHTLEQKKTVSSCGSWLDTWDSMEKDCKEEVVLLPFNSIRLTLDKYLKKHSFCCECANMVNKAFTYLIEEGKEPARAAGEKTEEDRVGEDGAKLNEDGSVNLFTGISACTKDAHVHVQCDPGFISQLLILAEPELSGLKQERHAKTIEIAQKEVLICIGITLFNRFQRIQQKLREGEQTCDLLCLVSLLSLRKSLDLAAERKRGVTDLELLCLEIEKADREKERRQARKREKKTKQQQKKKELKIKDHVPEPVNAACSAEDCKATGGGGKEEHRCPHVTGADSIKDRGESGSVSDSDSGLSSGYSGGETSPMYSREDGRFEGGRWIKGGSPDLGLEDPGQELDKVFPGNYEGARGRVRGRLHDTLKHGEGLVPSLVDLLEEEGEEREGEVGISPEEIKLFRSMLPELNFQRQQLRENLREKFAALCKNTDHARSVNHGFRN